MESTPELLNYHGSNLQSGDLFNNFNEFIETGSLDSAIDYNSSTSIRNSQNSTKAHLLHDSKPYEATNPTTPNFSDVSIFSILTAPIPATGSPLSDDSVIIPPKTITRSSSLSHNHKINKKPSLSRLNSKRSPSQIGNHLNHVLYTSSNESTSRMSPLCTKLKGMAPKHTASSGAQSNYSSSPTAGNGNFPTMCVFRHNSDGTNAPFSPNEMTTSKYKYDTVVERKKSNIKKEVVSSSDETSDERSSESNEAFAPVKKKYTRRRLLPRSKNGCWICRIKHLKCDESRPVCGSCLKFGIDCDYNPVKPDYVTDKNLRKQKLIDITTTRKKQATIRGDSKKKKSKSGN
ncbi:Transcriptional regulatory protein UME6 [Spathaspora sp. JA1]|nr:Transcriptional regulatory protein UME6 [Spathaspora sp. JA1]